MPIDLSDKKWPPERKHIGEDLLHEGYVSEGQAIAMPLGFPGMAEPIPPDEAYVTALAVDDRDVVYGGTGGRKAHLFAALTRGVTGAVVDMCALEDDARVTSVNVAGDGRVLATTAPGGSRHDTDPHDAAGEGQGALYIHAAQGLPYDLIQEWSFRVKPAEKLAEPLPDEGIADAVLVTDMNLHERVCGIGERTGTLFSTDVESGETEVMDPVDVNGLFSKSIVVGADGRVYGTGTKGRLWRYDPVSGDFDRTDAAVPALAGRSVRGHAESFAVDRGSGHIYGGTADGLLFEFDPAAMTVRSLGMPTPYRGARGLAVTNDGRLYGIAGRAGDVGHLFRYDPAGHDLRDVGLVACVYGPRVYGYEFSCGAVGRDGQVFLGQHERGGHLWLYWPAVARGRPSGE